MTAIGYFTSIHYELPKNTILQTVSNEVEAYFDIYTQTTSKSGF